MLGSYTQFYANVFILLDFLLYFLRIFFFLGFLDVKNLL